jgi:hypothetical protein
MSWELRLVCSHGVAQGKAQPVGVLIDERKSPSEVRSVEVIFRSVVTHDGRLQNLDPSPEDAEPPTPYSARLAVLRRVAGAMHERDTQVRFRQSSWRTTKAGAHRETAIVEPGRSYHDQVKCRRCRRNPRPTQEELGVLMDLAATTGRTVFDIAGMDFPGYG